VRGDYRIFFILRKSHASLLPARRFSQTKSYIASDEGRQLKRGINRTHIHVSGKHLPKYLGEFEYRYNMRHVPHLMPDRRMVSFVR
jgi:hypothetical protein